MATKRHFGLKRSEIIGLIVGVLMMVVIIVVGAPLLHSAVDHVMTLNPTLVYIVVGLLVFAEAAIFVGFIFPGETAVIIGGVVASQGRVNIVALCALVVITAILGDSVGYAVGNKFGDRILEHKLVASRRAGIDWALALLGKRGAIAVFIGRFTAFLRAVMPALAGAARMHYRTFLLANAAGGIVWGIGFTLLGYALGSAYKKAEKYASWASTTLLILIAIVAVTIFVTNKRREFKAEQAATDRLDALGKSEDPAQGLEELRKRDTL
jgi:hypothetical protein